MTTVAYRNGVIAADTGLTAGNLRDSHIIKIAKNKAGHVAGACGDAWWIAAFLKWFKSGGDLPTTPGTNFNTAIAIRSLRGITFYESGEGRTRFYAIKAAYHAIGSGRHLATGAMFAGAHPVDAVRAALAHDEGTHGRVVSLRLGK